ncbi:MAG: Uncharacterised protein [Cryomorphaceae bacterium]|nr:MAG: Uncharacterised protein [Cryomorphaceae bacterium]
MSTTDRSKTLEFAAITVGALAVAASAYFIFMTDGDAFRLTNWVISLAFVVFVAYNFVNVRNLKGAIEELVGKNETLQSELGQTQSSLTQAQGDVEMLKTDLLAAQRSIEEKDLKIKVLEEKSSTED